jgi:hypothetical protein
MTETSTLRNVSPILIAVALTFTAAAVEEHEVQGNYDGRFTKGPLKDWPASGQVVAEGGGKYGINFRAGSGQTRFTATTAESGANPTFEGTIRLEDGEYDVVGEYKDGSFVCWFDGNEKHTVQIDRVKRGSFTLGQEPPEGAIVLMDGTNLDEWETDPLKWKLLDNGDAEVANPELISKREFGDLQLHIEFRTPFMPSARGQARGNSGVYLQSVYEVQVLDSFGSPPADNLCGGIYGVAVPAFSACHPPLEWQTYDITFRAPRFDVQGKKTENARITVNHNNYPIHTDVELPGVTAAASRNYEAPLGPIKLQHHGNPVRYRNVWAIPLD